MKPKKTSSSLSIKWLILLFLLILLGSAFFFIKQERALLPVFGSPPLKIAIDIWPGNFWAIIAEKKGFFREAGLNAELVDVSLDFNGFLQKLIAGELDAHLISIFDLVEQNLKGADLVAILSADTSLTAEGMMARAPYKKLEDIRGKRIGVEEDTYLDFYLDAAMANAGVKSDDFIKVDIPTDDLADKFDSERLDAAIAWEPILTEMAEKYGLKKIFVAKDIKGLSPSILAMRKQFVQDNPEMVQKMMEAWKRSTEFILDQPEEAARIISTVAFAEHPEGGHYTPEELLTLMDQDRINSLDENLQAFSFAVGIESLYGNIQYVSRYLQNKGVTEVLPPLDRMLNPVFLRNLK